MQKHLPICDAILRFSQTLRRLGARAGGSFTEKLNDAAAEAHMLPRWLELLLPCHAESIRSNRC